MATGDSQTVIHLMEGAAGAGAVSRETDGYVVDGKRPRVVVLPEDIDSLSRVLAAASESNVAVAPRGGGTRTQVGNKIARLDVVVDLTRLNRVIQYSPADLTATVEAGTTLTRLQQTLSEHGQFLALDPPLPSQSTVGGTLAAGVSGPLKWQFGNPRDLVVGMRVVLADGKVTKSGGQVVKNVSGYDMARLHVGGLGTLGIIAEVSFKLTPMPRGEATIVASFDSSQRCLSAGVGIFHSHVVPLALTTFDSRVNKRGRVTGLDGPHLLAVRLGGRPRTLERQMSDCGAVCRGDGATKVETLDGADADALWRRLADFGWDEQTETPMAARASLKPGELAAFNASLGQSADAPNLAPAIISHPGYGTVLVSWLSDTGSYSPEEAAGTLHHARDAAHRAGGHLIIERCPVEFKAGVDVWDDVGEPLATMRRMKEQYDPKGILNPGRYAGGI